MLVAGGIDLSVGATYALASVVATKLALSVNPVLAIAAGIGVGLAVGLVNGVIATYFRINSLIATLTMSFVVGGLASLVTGGNLIIAYSALGYAKLARSSFLTVNTSTWTMLVVVIGLGVAHHIDFAPYELDELMAIGRVMLDRSSYYLSGEAEAAFRDYLTLRMTQPRFANARSVRNELERARLRHAHRLASDPELSRSKDDLMRIAPADILTSPVFSLPASLSAMEESFRER